MGKKAVVHRTIADPLASWNELQNQKQTPDIAPQQQEPSGKKKVVIARAIVPGQTLTLAGGKTVNMPEPDSDDDEIGVPPTVAEFRARGASGVAFYDKMPVLGDPEEYVSAVHAATGSRGIHSNSNANNQNASDKDIARMAKMRTLTMRTPSSGDVDPDDSGAGDDNDAASIDLDAPAAAYGSAAGGARARAEDEPLGIDTDEALAQRRAKMTLQERLAEQRQMNALQRWQHANKMWETFKRKAAKRSGRDPDSTVLSGAEDFRAKVEHIHNLRRAAPESEKITSWENSLRGGGVRYVRIGNAYTGLYVPVKDEDPNKRLEAVRRPHASRARDDPKQEPWMTSKYLQERHDLLLEKNREEGDDHVPHFDALEVVGTNIFDLERSAAAAKEQVLSRSIGAAAGLKSRDGAALAAAAAAAGGGGGDLGLSTTYASMSNYPSAAKLAASVNSQNALTGAVPPVQMDGPSLVFQGDRLVFDTFIGETSFADFEIRNNGTTVVFYKWVHLGVEPLGKLLVKSRSQRFFLDDLEGSIQPGQVKHFTFSFTSPVAGLFRDRWVIRCSPELTFGDHQLELVSNCEHVDSDSVHRARIEDRLHASEVQHAAEYVIKDILQRVRTPPKPRREFRPMSKPELLFIRQNRTIGLFYHPGCLEPFYEVFAAARPLVDAQRKLHILEALDPKLAKKREKAGGAGAGAAAGAAATTSRGANKDSKLDPNALTEEAEKKLPPLPNRWDHSVVSLHTLIAEIEDNWERQNLLHKFQKAVDDCTAPEEGLSAAYPIAFTLLAETLGKIPAMVDGLREELHLPALRKKKIEYPNIDSLDWALGPDVPPPEPVAPPPTTPSTGPGSAHRSKSGAANAGALTPASAPPPPLALPHSATASASSAPAAGRTSVPPPPEPPVVDEIWSQDRIIAEEEYSGKIQSDVAHLLYSFVDSMEAICSVPEARAVFPANHGLFFPDESDPQLYNPYPPEDPKAKKQPAYDPANPPPVVLPPELASKKMNAKERKAIEDQLRAQMELEAKLKAIKKPKHPARVDWDQDKARLPPGPKEEPTAKKKPGAAAAPAKQPQSPLHTQES